MVHAPIKFTYTNHRGEVAERTVTDVRIIYSFNPGYDYLPGWFLDGFDLDKRERRSFALTNITPERGSRIYTLFSVGDLLK